jgi:proteasome lid subunit RPN8/RPN11
MLRIENKLLSNIWKHAAEEYPAECCGVLLGTRGRSSRNVMQIVRCRNVHITPKSRYSIAPEQLISIQRDARDLKLEIVGFYHSHPDHPAVASETDLAEANWSGCSYLIVGMERGSGTNARSYVLNIENESRIFVEESLIEAAVQP